MLSFLTIRRCSSPASTTNVGKEPLSRRRIFGARRLITYSDGTKHVFDVFQQLLIKRQVERWLIAAVELTA